MHKWRNQANRRFVRFSSPAPSAGLVASTSLLGQVKVTTSSRSTRTALWSHPAACRGGWRGDVLDQLPLLPQSVSRVGHCGVGLYIVIRKVHGVMSDTDFAGGLSEISTAVDQAEGVRQSQSNKCLCKAPL
jgi:hypothetical protein